MTALEDTRTPVHSWGAAWSDRMAAVLEAVAVLVCPGVLYVVLRLRGMAPAQLPDPSMHTTFIIDPKDIFARYEALFTPTSRLREAARVGFLVPARVSYLLFGAVPGFFAFRYVLALIAIVPLYVLLKKLYGRGAGFMGIVVVMSSPVVLTAWGTDYPDSAAISYLTGGLAALALSWEGPWRLGWLLGGGVLLTMGVWAHGVSVPLVAVLVVVYLAVRLLRERAHLGRDVAVLVGSAVVVTGLLAICSKLLLGQFDFITPTVRSARSLSTASALRANHSASWSWAPYVTYLLVPPAIVLSYFVVIARRRSRDIGTIQLFVGLTGALQLATFVYLQFVGSFQALEMHYFSSVLWSSVNVLLAMTVAEVTRTFLASRVATAPEGASAERRGADPAWFTRSIVRAVPALLVLAVALAYEAAVRAGLAVPAMTWARWGFALAAIVLAGAAVGRLTIESTRRADDRRTATRTALWRVGSAVAVVLIVAAALTLTVAPRGAHGRLAHTVYDPPPAYAMALGGNDTIYVDKYRNLSALPGFVGAPAYKGEILLTWAPHGQFGDLLGPMGIYHNAFTWVSKSFPKLDLAAVTKINAVRAAQVLLLSLTGRHFAQAVRSLARFQPVVIRRTILSHGSSHLHAWLVDLQRYLGEPVAPRRRSSTRASAASIARHGARHPAQPTGRTGPGNADRELTGRPPRTRDRRS
jgi:hypothetical protein